MTISGEIINRAAAALGISEIGITTAAPLEHMIERLNKRIAEKRISPFEEADPCLRITPRHLLKDCRTVITLAVPYARPNNRAQPTSAGPRGLVARCARTTDYHLIVGNIAGQLVRVLASSAKKAFNYRVLCDRSPLLERELAFRSGLGDLGQSCCLINRRHGSYIVLGTILLDFAVEPKEIRKNKMCLNCGRCMAACPTGALVEPYVIDPFRCISYLTQAAGVIRTDLRTAMGNRIYGCDCCQEACPHNEKAELSRLGDTSFEFFPAEPLLIPLLTMTRREYDQTIGLTSAGWRGKTTIQRNVAIALGNLGDDAALRPLAGLLENDSRPLIRLHAAWALGQIGGQKARYALEKSCLRDSVSEVRAEAKEALNHIST